MAQAATLTAAERSTPAQPFTLINEQFARLSDMSDSARHHELGLLIYAHSYREACKKRFVAILSLTADLALQAEWQANRERLIAEADDAIFGVQWAEAAE